MKRQNNAVGKMPIATPNVGPPPMLPLETALSGAIGARIRLTTNIPTQLTLEGTLFTVCPLTNLIAFATATTPSPTHHIISISTIQKFELLSAPASNPKTFTTAQPPLSPIPTALLLSRANAAVARLQEAAARKNKSVTKEAQEIFDALTRTLPTRWDGTSIVVMDAVVISSPYRVEDCKAVAGQQASALARVKKVLENERKRVAERSNKVVPAVPTMPVVPAGTQRKGG
jgi:hypothetical protein